MMKNIPASVQQALSVTRAAAVEHNKGMAPYAITYIDAMQRCLTEMERQVQVDYVLCNVGWWRGDAAREAKKILNLYAKGKPVPKLVQEECSGGYHDACLAEVSLLPGRTSQVVTDDFRTVCECACHTGDQR